jgi:uncharacterized protein YcbX
MATEHTNRVSVASLWRYPVKSMQGEELNASEVTDRGLRGDRAFALVDAAEGRVASAKNPWKWPHLFDFRAAFIAPVNGGKLPPVRLTLPDGTTVSSEQADHDQRVSAVLGRTVTLTDRAPAAPMLEEYWPDLEGLPHRDKVTDEAMPAGTFFDLATVHLLTTSTIDRLHELYPQGRFEVRRFRPNIVISSDVAGLVEQGWVGRTILLGSTVRLQVIQPCGRCVMTTLPQADLPHDPGILRTAVRHTQGQVGVYARVLQGGVVRRGDAVKLE